MIGQKGEDCEFVFQEVEHCSAHDDHATKARTKSGLVPEPRSAT
jgi:hypothetical protein